MPLKYCLDTSALIEPWVRHYPPDVFDSLWDKLASIIDAGTIRAPIEVRRELERQSDGLFEWAGNANGLFEEADEEQLQKCKVIVNAFPTLVSPNSPKSQADPFVIAMAEIRGVPVVTYETLAKQNAAPKIPNVCKALDVKIVSFVDVLRAEGFKF
jgi:hypothetical protein